MVAAAPLDVLARFIVVLRSMMPLWLNALNRSRRSCTDFLPPAGITREMDWGLEQMKRPRRLPAPESSPTLPASGPWNAAVLNCEYGFELQPVPVSPTMRARGAKAGEPGRATLAAAPPPRPSLRLTREGAPAGAR